MVSPAFTGFFFTFAAVVLFVIISVSAPIWDRVFFLRAVANGNSEVFGVFGYCAGGTCSKAALGYDLTLSAIGQATNYGNSTLQTLTKALIIHPIAGALSLLAFLWGLFGVCAASRACTILMAITSFLALLASLLALGIDLAMWIIVRNKIRDGGYEAELGNAIWMTIGATVALILATCTAACGSCGRFASGRMGGEKY